MKMLIILIISTIACSAYAQALLSKSGVHRLLQLCNKNLESKDILHRDVITKIQTPLESSDCVTPHETLAPDILSVMMKMTDQNSRIEMLRLVNHHALETSMEAFMAYSVTRTLNTNTNKTYDLNNVQDVIQLRKIVCGLDFNQEHPSYGICDSQHNKNILAAAIEKVKKEKPKFLGEKGVYGFKVSEAKDFHNEIQSFNKLCEVLKNEKKLTKPDRPLYETRDPNNKFLKEQYEALNAIYLEGQSRLHQKIAELFDSQLGWLLMTESMRKSIGFEGKYGSAESFCSKPLVVPGIQALQNAMSEFQLNQLKEVATGLRYSPDKLRWEKDVYADSNNYYRLRERIISNPNSIATVLEAHPKLEYVAEVCNEVRGLYTEDKIDRVGQKILLVGGLVVSGAMIASGLGAPIGAEMLTALGLIDTGFTMSYVQDSIVRVKKEKNKSQKIASSVAVGTLPAKEGGIELLESDEKIQDIQESALINATFMKAGATFGLKNVIKVKADAVIKTIKTGKVKK